ncbi:MAG: hypothetical protein MUP36_04090, partial [Demequinaceae bacterium]|nr:hypothetical protein [Demequinaceae bacterium]
MSITVAARAYQRSTFRVIALLFVTALLAAFLQLANAEPSGAIQPRCNVTVQDPRSKYNSTWSYPMMGGVYAWRDSSPYVNTTFTTSSSAEIKWSIYRFKNADGTPNTTTDGKYSGSNGVGTIYLNLNKFARYSGTTFYNWLRVVVIHEFGHALLGPTHQPDGTNSVMTAKGAIPSKPTSLDIANIAAIC